MTSSVRVPALSLAAVGALVLAAGCGACSKQGAAPETPAVTQAPAPKATRADKPPKPEPEPFVLTGHMAAIEVGDRAFIWTDGRTATVGQKTAQVRWSPEGFEFDDGQAVRVYGPGGATYWRVGPGEAEAKPLAEILQQQTTPPPGFKIESGEGRGGRVRVTLQGPSERRVRVGSFPEGPKAVVWLEGKLPEGTKAAPELGKGDGFKLNPEGHPHNAAPEGAEVVAAEPAAEARAAWEADLKKIAGAGATVAWARTLDLDGDEPAEGAACVSGGTGSYSCYVVDTLGEKRRYHAVNIPWSGGAPETAPVAFTRGGHGYVVYAGRPARTDEGTPPVLHLVSFDGGAFTVDMPR